MLNKKEENDEDVLSLIGEGSRFKDELCDMIESAQMFDDFPRDEVEIIAGYSRAYECDKGASIFKEGQKGSFMCILTAGRVDIFKESDSREAKKITTIRRGKTMGEMSLLDDLPHSATTVATEPCQLVLITKNNFDKLADDNPALGNKILRKIARLMSLRLRQTTGVLLDFLDKS